MDIIFLVLIIGFELQSYGKGTMDSYLEIINEVLQRIAIIIYNWIKLNTFS